MSIEATKAAWRWVEHRLASPPDGPGDPATPATIVVLLKLADLHHFRDGECYASQSGLAATTGVNRVTIQRILSTHAEEWERFGMLKIDFRNGTAPTFRWLVTCSPTLQVYESDQDKPVASDYRTCSPTLQVLPKPVASHYSTPYKGDSHPTTKPASKSRTPRRAHPLPATRPNAERLLAIIVRGLGDAWGSEPVVNGKREKVLTQLDDLLTAKDFDEVEALYADKLVDAASDPYRRAALRDVVTVASVDGYNALLAVKPKAGRPWQPGDELPHWTDEFPDMALRAMPQAEHDRREREWQERKRNR